MNTIQIISLFLILLITSSLLGKNRITKIIISVIFPIIVIIQISSVITSGNFFNYQIYVHLDIEGISQYAFLYLKKIFLLTTAYGFIAISIYHSSKLIRLRKRFVMVILPALLLVITIPKHSISRELLTLATDLSSYDIGFDQSLENMQFDNYIMPDNIHAKPGKNIVIISMESLEMGYLRKYPQLTPNLNRLADSWTFYNMQQSPGASWTAGSLYALLSGLPASFGIQGNNIFQNATLSKLATLGVVLDQANYNSRYVMGNISFAGSNDLLKLNKITPVDQTTAIGTYPQHPVGLNDLDLFNEAKLQIEQLSSNDQHFALFLSTINGHAPNGIYDERMLNFIASSSKDVDFSVQALDYLVGDFIQFLSDKDLLDSTSVFIVPDHLMMGSNKIIDTFTENGTERSLYLITNEKENSIGKSTVSPLLQYDLPRVIINGAGIDSNAKFMSDYIENDLIQFVKNNMPKITNLNISALSDKNHEDKFSTIKQKE